MNLEDYPTPLTDSAIEETAFENKNHPHTDWVAAFFARDLERKLALAREALTQISNACVMKSKDSGECITAEHKEIATEALTLTA
jgi:hypothetical protein